MTTTKQRKKARGFSLIELLVVIAIIGILAMVAVISFGSSRGKARDAKRLADFRVLRNALEFFYDRNGRYPDATDGNCGTSQSFLAGGCLQGLVSAGIIGTIPKDPLSAQQYYYDNWCRVPSGTNNQQFRMWATGELDNDGIANGWWVDTNVGQTNCEDPS